MHYLYIARFWGDENMVKNFNTISSEEEVYRYGTIVYHWLIAFYNMLKNDVNNVDATNLLYFADN